MVRCDHHRNADPALSGKRIILDMVRAGFLVGILVLLGACAAQSVYAPDDVVQRATYVHDGPPAITLITMRNTQSENGAHTALMINASQRVIFDPAGSFAHPILPERNDVLYGASPRAWALFKDAHVRAEYYMVEQRLEISAAQAESILQRAINYGTVPQAFCTTATARLISETPGLGSVRSSFFPDSLSKSFGQLPGVVTTEHRDSDGSKQTAIDRFNAANGVADQPSQ